MTDSAPASDDVPAIVNGAGEPRPDSVERARRYFDQARAANTVRAYRAGWMAFVRWCGAQGVEALPAAPAAVAAFAADMAGHYTVATVRARLSAIAAVHRHEGHPSPCDAQAVRDVMKGIARWHGTRQAQARGITDRDVARIEAQLGDGLRELRDHAMLLVARDLLARRSELAALDAADLAFTEAGDGTATIRRSKTDQTGEGHTGYLGRAAVTALRSYLDTAGITEGAVFRAVRNGGHVGERVSERGVERAFKRLAARAGLDAQRVSGHSARVGMAQDLAAHGTTVTELMQAGRWASERMPARYTERQAAKRNAVARFHGAQ